MPSLHNQIIINGVSNKAIKEGKALNPHTTIENTVHDQTRENIDITPGDILADELDARGWTQADFADVLGRPTQFVSEIISGKKEITIESAAQIGAVLGTSAEFWLNL